jgi:predicted Zn-dependent protease
MRRLSRALRPLHLFAAGMLISGCSSFSQLNLVSEQEEIEMGEQFSAQLAKELQFVTDREVVSYVNDLGQSLARVSKRSNLTYHFYVVDSDEVNAFAVPGGHLYVNRGLIETAGNESELAGVMGHEIGHIVGRHSARQMSQQYGIQVLAGLALGRDPGLLAQLTASILATGAMMRYSRAMESEADAYGVEELHDAGIDPNGLPVFFDKLMQMEQSGEGGAIEKYFSSHPAPGDRAATTRAQIAKLPARSYRQDSPDFQRIKMRVS